VTTLTCLIKRSALRLLISARFLMTWSIRHATVSLKTHLSFGDDADVELRNEDLCFNRQSDLRKDYQNCLGLTVTTVGPPSPFQFLKPQHHAVTFCRSCWLVCVPTCVDRRHHHHHHQSRTHNGREVSDHRAATKCLINPIAKSGPDAHPE